MTIVGKFYFKNASGSVSFEAHGATEDMYAAYYGSKPVPDERCPRATFYRWLFKGICGS